MDDPLEGMFGLVLTSGHHTLRSSALKGSNYDFLLESDEYNFFKGIIVGERM